MSMVYLHHLTPPDHLNAACSAANLAQLSRFQLPQRRQNVLHERLEVDHTIRRRPDDQHAQRQHAPVLLVSKTSIHGQQDIEMGTSAPKQLAVLRPGPAGRLYRGDLMLPQFGGKSTRQVLVKQNAHGPEPSFEPDPARQAPGPARRTETGRGTDRASLRLPGSRTESAPARACHERPAYPPRFPGRSERRKAIQPASRP